MASAALIHRGSSPADFTLGHVYLGILLGQNDLNFTKHAEVRRLALLPPKSTQPISCHKIHKLYKMVARPALEYAQQVIAYDATTLARFEVFQTEKLRRALHLPADTDAPSTRLLAGIAPLAARFDALKLRFLDKLITGEAGSLANSICSHRLETYNRNPTSSGFVPHVAAILKTLGLELPSSEATQTGWAVDASTARINLAYSNDLTSATGCSRLPRVLKHTKPERGLLALPDSAGYRTYQYYWKVPHAFELARPLKAPTRRA